jgi:hypothetical protein
MTALYISLELRGSKSRAGFETSRDVRYVAQCAYTQVACVFHVLVISYACRLKVPVAISRRKELNNVSRSLELLSNEKSCICFIVTKQEILSCFHVL